MKKVFRILLITIGVILTAADHHPYSVQIEDRVHG